MLWLVMLLVFPAVSVGLETLDLVMLDRRYDKLMKISSAPDRPDRLIKTVLLAKIISERRF